MSSLDYYIRKLIAEAGMEADRRARDMTIDIEQTRKWFVQRLQEIEDMEVEFKKMQKVKK